MINKINNIFSLSVRRCEMKPVFRLPLSIVGVVIVLMGLVWFFQGINVLPGSFMTGQTQWAINGAIAMVIGAVIVWFANRRNEPPTK
jgi:hypothetical protein